MKNGDNGQRNGDILSFIADVQLVLAASQSGKGEPVPPPGRRGLYQNPKTPAGVIVHIKPWANEHRRCPLSCTVANVLPLDDVLEIMLQYAVTGTRSGEYLWDDVSKSWIEEEADKFGTIKQIKPKGAEKNPK